MANNRQILSLGDLAFEALLRHRTEIAPDTDDEYDILMRYKLRKEIRLFLQYIADADLDSAKELLEENPQLAVIAYGTVTTSSGNTYENVTAVQLAYLMDDVEMCNMMLTCIKKLPKNMIEKAGDQLTKKMAEVEAQQSQFKPYDFSAIVQAITSDQMLKDTGQPSPDTEKTLAKFKEDFKPCAIKTGKSFIKAHLQEGYRVCSQNLGPWHENQLLWYLINIIGSMQCGVEKCCEQEFGQGLGQKKTLKRSVKLSNSMNDVELTYRGAVDASLILGRDYFVDIYFGGLSRKSWGTGSRAALVILRNHVEQKKSGMEKFKQGLQQLVHEVVLDQHSHGC